MTGFREHFSILQFNIVLLGLIFFSAYDVKAQTSSITPISPSIITRSLSIGMTGKDVSELQQFLKDSGFFKYPSITGYFGSVTHQAVIAFQRANKIDPIGVVGPKTRGAITTQISYRAKILQYNFNMSHSITRIDKAETTSTPTPTVTADTTAPVISSISSGTPTDSGTTITWTTDENSTSQINYGTTDAYGVTTTIDSTQTTSHSVVLSGLSAATTYHYRVRSVDASDNLTVSSDQTFVTARPTWLPQVGGNYADFFSDYSTEGGTNHYWGSGANYASASAYLAAITGTFTRASVAYYTAISGLLASTTANNLRFDYGPTSHTARGVLLEGSSGNLLNPSENTATGYTLRRATVVNNALTSPDGNTGAIKVVESVDTGFHYITQEANHNIISVFAKAGERDWIWLDPYDGSTHFTYFDLTNGVVGTNASGNTATIIPYPNGWYLCIVRRAGGTNPEFGVASADNTASYAGDDSKGVYLWGMQARTIDDGTVDSYIRTGDSNLTLKGYWKMDESGTGTRADSTSNGWTLTNNNSVTNASGLLNNASSFTRASSMYLSHADASDLRPSGSFGVSVWVKFNSLANYADLISKWAGTQASNEFTLEVSGAGTVGFYVSNSTTGTASVTWGTPLTTGTWYNIVAWHDDTRNLLGITVNNGTPATAVYTGGISCSSCAAEFQIGSTDTGSWDPHLNGLLDEVAYFNGAPSAAERTFIYGSGTPPSYSSWPSGATTDPARAQDFLLRTLGSSPAAVTKVLEMRTPRILPVSGSYQIMYHMDNDSEADDFEAYRDDSGHILVEVHKNNGSEGILDMGVVANDTDLKLAFRGQTNDLAASLNGGAVVKDTSITWPTTFVRERWGVNQLNTRHWNSTLKSDATFLRAVSDTELRTLSSP